MRRSGVRFPSSPPIATLREISLNGTDALPRRTRALATTRNSLDDFLLIDFNLFGIIILKE